jgi:hypothetical protein
MAFVIRVEAGPEAGRYVASVNEDTDALAYTPFRARALRFPTSWEAGQWWAKRPPPSAPAEFLPLEDG